MKSFPIAGPWITQKEIDYVADATATGWYKNAAHYNTRFEQAFAEYLGVRHAVTLPSCTSAIHLSLAALNVGPGDEVIVPDATWIASSAPISYVGAKPIFADIDADTWCLSAESFETCITPKTRAVIPVDLYGNMPDMNAIRKIADAHSIAIVEDAAEAIGSEYRGRRAGVFGDTGTFSFHGSKTLTTGEGGMLVTDSDDLHARVQVLRDHGRSPGDRMFYNTEVAYRYKMSAMQAALGLAQLERIDELIRKKRQIFDWYREELSGLNGVRMNHEPKGIKNSYWMVTIVLDESYRLDKQTLMHRLRERGIDSRPFFFPLSNIPAYRHTEQARAGRERNRVAYAVSRAAINLPSALSLEQDDVRTICREVKAILALDQAGV
jgi:perosamine synthetase